MREFDITKLNILYYVTYIYITYRYMQLQALQPPQGTAVSKSF